MPFRMIRNDITKVKADIIVNTANPHPVIGSGTDSAIYHAAGEELLLKARKKIGDIPPGQAAVKPAFGLSAKHIIHTVGPAWVDGDHGERDILRSCYVNSLSLARELDAASIAFPLIAAGVYGFPKDEALNIAMAEIGRFLLTNDMNVILVVFDRAAFELLEKLVGQIDAYIDEHGVGLVRETEYGSSEYRKQRRGDVPAAAFPAYRLERHGRCGGVQKSQHRQEVVLPYSLQTGLQAEKENGSGVRHSPRAGYADNSRPAVKSRDRILAQQQI